MGGRGRGFRHIGIDHPHDDLKLGLLIDSKAGIIIGWVELAVFPVVATLYAAIFAVAALTSTAILPLL